MASGTRGYGRGQPIVSTSTCSAAFPNAKRISCRLGAVVPT